MQVILILAGMAGMALAFAFQFNPNTQGWDNLCIFGGGLVLFLMGAGTVAAEEQKSPAPQRRPERPKTRADEQVEAYELGIKTEKDWRTGQEPKNPIRAAATIRAWHEHGRDDLAREFASGWSDKFIRAVLRGAESIDERS